MVRVERITPSSHVKGRYLVFLDTGTMVKVGEQELLDFALRTGAELEEAELNRLLASARDTAARERAARLVGRRPLSKGELVNRLVTKGEGRSSAEQAADWLEELGAVNDEEYARTVVRHYDRMGYGPQKLREELRRRKVPRELWTQALDQARPQQELAQAFLAQKLRNRPVTDKELQRQTNALRRRGFDWEAIRAAVEPYRSQVSRDWEEF